MSLKGTGRYHENLIRRSGALGRALIVLLLTASAAGAAPWVLPSGLTLSDTARSYDGLTVYCVQGNDTIYVVNMKGEVVHEWTIGVLGAQLKPLPNGRVLVYTGERPQYKDIVTEYDWNGNLVWTFSMPQAYTEFHHDLVRLTNGNTLCLASRKIMLSKILPRKVIDDVLLEVSPEKKVVWKWSVLEHFNQLGLTKETLAYIKSHPKAVDLFHTNSLQVLPRNKWEATDSRFKAGNILVGMRNTNLIFILDRETGHVVWSMEETIGQHHASMIPEGMPGEGNILVFDNGGGVGFPPKYRYNSVVKEFDPQRKKLVWHYQATDTGRASDTFFSLVRCSAQRLPNGNTLIVESTFGRIFEVTQNKEVVWEYINPHYRWDVSKRFSNQIYRAYRVDATWPTGNVVSDGSGFAW